MPDDSKKKAAAKAAAAKKAAAEKKAFTTDSTNLAKSYKTFIVDYKKNMAKNPKKLNVAEDTINSIMDRRGRDGIKSMGPAGQYFAKYKPPMYKKGGATKSKSKTKK